MKQYIIQIIAGVVLLAGICLLALAHMNTDAFGAVSAVVGSAATYLFGQRTAILAGLKKLRKVG